jgi:hypothetical protein
VAGEGGPVANSQSFQIKLLLGLNQKTITAIGLAYGNALRGVKAIDHSNTHWT